MGRQNAFIVQPELKQPLARISARTPQTKLKEASGLAEAIQLEVIHQEIIFLSKTRSGTYLGPGVIERLADLATTSKHPLIIINTNLSPIQHRNLETSLKCKVIDRTALILEIFGARANTHAGRLQVELAALTFQKSRLVRSWTHLERQRGGGGFLGGPGERQIELDRRMLTDQVKQIKKELSDVERTRGLQRRNRGRSETPTVALVGYTNAGKSTLFNRLTGANVLSKDMLFATLDPTMRGMVLPSGRQIVLADTVGFISALPTELVEAFKSTLEEVVQADLILHVHDMSSNLCSEEASDVFAVLDDIGIDEHSRDDHLLHIFNKADIADEAVDIPFIQTGLNGRTMTCSALSGSGVDDLLNQIDKYFAQRDADCQIIINPEHAAASAWLHQHASIVESRYNAEGQHIVRARLSPANKARFHKHWPDIEARNT